MRPVQGGMPIPPVRRPAPGRAAEHGEARPSQVFDEHLQAAGSRAAAAPAPTGAAARSAVGERAQEHDDPDSLLPDPLLAALLIAARLQPPQMLPEVHAALPLEPQSARRVPEITPHDLRASLSAAWMQAADPLALAPDQWHFALAADAHTPLAALRLSGDAVHGWSLHVTASRGVTAQHLQDRGERLRTRLQARGQNVRELRIDDEEAGA